MDAHWGVLRGEKTEASQAQHNLCGCHYLPCNVSREDYINITGARLALDSIMGPAPLTGGVHVSVQGALYSA